VAGCAKCEGFSECINFEGPGEYRDIARQLIKLVDQETFVLVKADCPLADLFNAQRPGDVLEHDFRCAACGRMYKLSADTYHGSASWKPAR
jgi:hypothetical protein